MGSSSVITPYLNPIYRTGQILIGQNAYPSATFTESAEVINFLFTAKSLTVDDDPYLLPLG